MPVDSPRWRAPSSTAAWVRRLFDARRERAGLEVFTGAVHRTLVVAKYEQT